MRSVTSSTHNTTQLLVLCVSLTGSSAQLRSGSERLTYIFFLATHEIVELFNRHAFGLHLELVWWLGENVLLCLTW